MIVGFTGTQRGLTGQQYASLLDVLHSIDVESPITQFHHGDCVGADKNAYDIIRQEYRRVGIHRHPPLNPSKRAFTYFDLDYEKKPYLDRNQDIVDASELMIATPGEMTEQLRSGTWATIRRARKAHKDLVIIYPDGSRIME